MTLFFILWVLSCISLLLSLLFSINRRGYEILFEPIILFGSFFVLYFDLPLGFITEINFHYSWGISNEQIFFTYLIVAMLNLVFSGLIFWVSFQTLSSNYTLRQGNNIFELFFFIIITCYVMVVFALKGATGQLLFNTEYIGSSGDPYKLKNVAYALLFITPMVFIRYQRLSTFFPNFLIIILDLLSGSRTVALIALTPVYLCLAITKKKLYLGYIFLFLILMVLVGIVRTSLDMTTLGVPVYIKALGEFRETFVTLPIFVLDSDYVGQGNGMDLINSLGSNLIQPLRAELNENFTRPGNLIQNLVGRGYGLGSNLIIDVMMYGYFGLVMIPLFVFGIFGLRSLFSHLSYAGQVVLVSYCVIFIRLGVREGMLSSLSLAIFIFCIYALPFLMLKLVLKAASLKTSES